MVPANINIEVVECSKKRKKGKRNVQCYASEIIKKSRVSGSAYTNSAGKPIMELKPGNDCKCHRMCYIKVSEENRLTVFKNFRGMSSKNEQDNYLQSLISASEVKQRRRRKPEEESNKPERGSSFIYEISTSSGKHQVCKTAFINIHDITNERMRRLTSLLKEGKTPTDKRGKNTPGNAKPGYVLEAVKTHIACFPVKIAHYSSKEFRYLGEQLNVLQMYNLFKESNPEIDIGYKLYLRVFKEDFSLSFGRPQVDTCCTCEELNVKIKSKFLNDVAKRVHVAEKLVHIRRANKFYSKMKGVKELMATQPNVGAICMDYMQNVSLPTVPVQETFYLCQLTVSVFCIHNLRDDSVVLFMYHEGIATKGPNEVTSFIMDYLKTYLNDIEHLHIFSDGCSAQNKNHTLLRVINSLVSIEKIKSAEQYFPIRGHSFLPCDRDFAVIKRKLRKFDRVFTVKELAEIILSAPKKNNFLVVIPESKDITDFKSWWPSFYKRNVLSDETRGRNVHKNDKVSFEISQFMHISHSCEYPGVIKAKNFIDGLQAHTFHLRNSKQCQLILPQNPAYAQGSIPINSKKMKDLEKFKPYIPDDECIRSFYDDIFAWPTIENEAACEVKQNIWTRNGIEIVR